MKIEGELTPAAIWEATRMKALPMVPVVEGSGEDGDARFYVVDSGVKDALLERFVGKRIKPTFVRDGTARRISLACQDIRLWGLIPLFRNIDQADGMGSSLRLRMSTRCGTSFTVLLLIAWS